MSNRSERLRISSESLRNMSLIAAAMVAGASEVKAQDNIPHDGGTAVAAAATHSNEMAPLVPEIDTTQYETVVVGTSVNIRSTSSTTGTIKGTLVRGDALVVTQAGESNGYYWAKIVEKNGEPVDGDQFVAIRGVSGTPIFLRDLVPVTPEPVPASEPNEAPAAVSTGIAPGSNSENPLEQPIGPAIAPVEVIPVIEEEGEWQSIFAEPKEEILEDRIKAGLSVPEYIRESEDWTFNPDAMTWEHVNESGEVVRYRPHMGDRALEDEEFSQHFRETAAFEVLDDNGKVEWRLSFEVSGEDSYLDSLSISPDLVSNYGMTEEEFASETRSLLEKHFSFLKKHEINNVIVVFRTDTRHNNPGTIISGYNNTFQYPVQGNLSTGIKVFEESGTVIILGALSSVQNHRVGENGPISVLANLVSGLNVGQRLDEGLSVSDILQKDGPEKFIPILSQLWSVGNKSEFYEYRDHKSNILSVNLK